MNTSDFQKPEQLDHYSFWWSETRLLVAACALLLGGVPPIRLLTASMPALWGIVNLGLTLAWIVSGLASGYLLYRWYYGGQLVFGGKAPIDLAAFFVMVVSGINLGLTGLLGRNIGMSIAYGRMIFNLTALVYMAAAIYLYYRWNQHGKKLF